MFEEFATNAVKWLIIAPVTVCFMGSFIGGTAVILVFATFGGSSELPWFPLLIGAVLGNYVSDICWFGLARSPLGNRLRQSKRFQTQSARIDHLRLNYRKRDWLFFIAIKFAYGLRIAQIIIFGVARYSWSRFLKLDGVAVLVINTTAVLSGWLFGRGVTRYLNLFENVGTFVSILAILLLAYSAGRWALNRYVFKRLPKK
jgi:membrane protein DedA with SNARE-associated domain